MKIIKFADELKNLVHNFLNKYIPNIEQINEEIKEKEILEIKIKDNLKIKTRKYTLRDFYINFAENLKTINKDLIKKKKINEIFQQFFDVNYNKIINIKINDKNINKANFLNNFKREMLNFINKYENILMNLNEKNKKEIWKEILKENIKNELKENKEKFLITDLRYEYENLNEKDSIYILIIPIDHNNNLKIKEKEVLNKINEVKKDYLNSRSLKEFKEILLSKYNVKKSEELSIAMIINYYFNKKNENLNKEINQNFNGIHYFINNFDETKENFQLKIKELMKKINNKNIIYILGGRRTGKDFIANNLIKVYLELESKKSQKKDLIKKVNLY